jgi:hypothetical protein
MFYRQFGGTLPGTARQGRCAPHCVRCSAEGELRLWRGCTPHASIALLCGAGCKTRTYRANLAEAGTELQSGFAQICICFGERFAYEGRLNYELAFII